MESQPLDPLPTLALPDERLREGFEQQWQALGDGETGIRPSLESTLENATESGLTDLLPHLLLIEVTERIRLGDDPTREEYHERFPAHTSLIDAVFDRASMTCSLGSRKVPSRAAATEFPGYEVLDVLGQGGMGIVCAARETATGRLVAIKQVRPDHSEPERLERFRREALVMQQLGHRHIVPLLAVGGEADRPFIVMEWVKGGSLEDRRDKKWTPREAAEFVAKLADALGSVHAKGIIHRDLKPANILLDESGEPLVSDFGLARLLDVEARMTASGAQLGTPAFMAPEQARGEIARIGPATDVHALGLILYELLTGDRPFDAGTVPAALRKVEETDPTPPRTINDNVPRDLETICLHCLHKDSARRYQTAGELASDLRRFLAGGRITARAVGLPEKAVKWSRRNRVVTALSIAAVCLLLVVGVASWLYYDHYHRPKTALFASYVNRHGVPEGRFPLSAEQASKRWSSYRITSRAGRVERVEVVDGLGRLNAESSHTAALERDTTTAGKVTRYEYTRKANGEIDEEQAFDRDGNLLWALHYTSPMNAHYRNPKGYPRARTGSGAAYLEFAFDANGYEEEVRYRDRSGNPHPNDEGVYGVRREHDSLGFTTRATFLDSEGKPTHNRKTRYATVLYVRDAKGNASEQKYLGLDEQPVVNSDGYHRQTAEHDGYGNLVTATYFDAEGGPAYSKPRAIHRSEVELDPRGFFVAVRFLDPEGKPTVASEGFATLQVRRDEQGNAIEYSYFDTEGNPTPGKGGYARETAELDASGRAVAWRYWDTAGKPTLTDGHHVWKVERDERGRTIEEAFFDAQDRRTLATAGYAVLRKSYDESGNRTEESYFGTDGKPITIKSGYAGARYRYDDRGNRIETLYVDGAGKPVFGDKGYARVRRKYDENGKEMEAEYLGPDDRPVIAGDLGIHRMTSVHDARGNPIEVTTYGIDRQLMVTKKGFARMRMRYDERDLELEYRFFDAADRPATTPDGDSTKAVAHDEFGNIIEQKFFGPDGKPVSVKGGYHGMKMKYDARGKPVEMSTLGVDGEPVWNTTLGFARMVATWRYGPLTQSDVVIYDKDGKPALGKTGAHRIVTTFDAQERELEARYFGIDGKPCLGAKGIAWATIRYDSRGKAIEVATFGTDDKPILTTEGMARITRRYDERGNNVEVAYFGIRDEPVCDAQKRVHRLEAKYDALNRLVEQSYFGTDGKPTIAVQGYARITRRLDELGNIVEEAHSGLDGKLIAIASGFAVEKRTHDERGRVTRMRVFDKEGKPAIALEIGVHEVRREYDSMGQVIAESYFGSDGKPATGAKHYASLRRKLDAFGNVVEEIRFDINGRQLRSVVKKFDPAGNEIETTAFGPDGGPIEVEGAHRQVMKYDGRGNQIEIAFFDTEGKRTLGEAGYHRQVSEYNAQNKPTRLAFFGPGGRPTRAKYGISSVESRYDERGHQREVEFFGPNGKPVTILSKASKVVFRRDERDRPLLEEHFGVDGKPVLGPEGAFRTTYLHNPRGHTDEVRYFGTDEKPILNAEGYSTLKQFFAEDMRSSWRAYFDAEGNPIVMKKGYARTDQKLDEVGNLIEERYSGANGKPIAVGGFARVTKKYNAHGKLIAEAWFGIDDKPVAAKDGYASYTSETDELGRVLRHSYFGLDGKPTPNQHGVSSWTATYDRRGVRIGERFFGPDGKPVLSKRGIAGYEYVLDDAGKKTAEIHYALDGKPFMKANVDARGRITEQELYRNASRSGGPTDVTRLAPITRRRFDSKGRITEEAYFDEQSKPLLLPDGYCRLTHNLKEEDAEGTTREERYFGPDGERVARKETGAFRAERRFSPRGTVIGIALFDRDDKPLVHPEGWASWRGKLDERGLQVELAYFGKDGKPAIVKEGYARATTRFDAKGRAIEWRFFGTEDKPILTRAGIASYRTKYDTAGRITEQSSSGIDGKPIVNRQLGYARVAFEFDERGNELSAKYFGVDGTAIESVNRYAQRVQKYDSSGKFISQTLFGADGKVREPRLVVGEVTPGGLAAKLGLRVGDVLWKLDGEEIRSMPQFASLRAKPRPGNATSPLLVQRGGQTLTVSVPAGLLGITMILEAKPVNASKEDK